MAQATGSVKEQNIEHFNKEASVYEQKYGELSRRAASAISDAVQLDSSFVCLDFACGPGTVSELLAPNVKHFYGVDTSENMVAVYNSKRQVKGIPNMSGVALDILDPAAVDQAVTSGLLPSSFDFICCLMALHHMEDVPAVLSALTSMLKPGGFMVLTDLAKTLDSTAFHSHYARHHGVAHPGGFTEEQLRGLLTQVGMTVQTVNNEAFFIDREVEQQDGSKLQVHQPVVMVVAKK
eukprot:jgi/Chrzof1/1199/Cz01g44130.t1